MALLAESFPGGTTGTRANAAQMAKKLNGLGADVVADYAAVKTGLTDARTAINDAQTAADSLVFPAGTYLISSDLTLSKHMVFARGATLKPASGITITIEGQVDAGYYQIFDTSAGGNIYFTKNKTGNVVKFAWFGNDPTGAVSSATALQKCINSVLGSANPVTTSRQSAAPIDLGTGVFLLDADINITSALGFRMYGHGPYNTSFFPSGTRTKLFDINGLSRSAIGDFSIDGNGTEIIDEVIAVYHDISGAARTTNYSVLENITIGASTRYKTGIHIGKTGQNTQCDTIGLRDVTVVGDWESGETTYWQKAVHWGTGAFNNCLDHKGYNLNLISCRYNAYVDCTQVAVFGFEMAQSEVDIFTTEIGSYVLFQGGRSEGSERLWWSGGGTSPAYVTLSDIDWKANGIHSDGIWVRHGYPGCLVLQNIRCGATVLGGVTPKIQLGTVSGGPGTLFCVGIIDGVQALAAVEDAIDVNGNSMADVRCYTEVNTSSQGLLTTRGTMIVEAGSANVARTIRAEGEDYPRWQTDGVGKQSWGGGSGVVDTNLYRSAADKLKTDDMFLATAGIGVGNSAAATTLGTVTKKIQVFDATGSSLGYVAVYDAIT